MLTAWGCFVYVPKTNCRTYQPLRCAVTSPACCTLLLGLRPGEVARHARDLGRSGFLAPAALGALIGRQPLLVVLPEPVLVLELVEHARRPARRDLALGLGLGLVVGLGLTSDTLARWSFRTPGVDGIGVAARYDNNDY